MALRTFVKCCPLLVTGLDHPSLALVHSLLCVICPFACWFGEAVLLVRLDGGSVHCWFVAGDILLGCRQKVVLETRESPRPPGPLGCR